jgi:hypothetical protein
MLEEYNATLWFKNITVSYKKLGRTLISLDKQVKKTRDTADQTWYDENPGHTPCGWRVVLGMLPCKLSHSFNQDQSHVANTFLEDQTYKRLGVQKLYKQWAIYNTAVQDSQAAIKRIRNVTCMLSEREATLSASVSPTRPQGWWQIVEDEEGSTVEMYGLGDKMKARLPRKTTMEVIAFLGEVYLRPSRITLQKAKEDEYETWVRSEREN